MRTMTQGGDLRPDFFMTLASVNVWKEAMPKTRDQRKRWIACLAMSAVAVGSWLLWRNAFAEPGSLTAHSMPKAVGRGDDAASGPQSVGLSGPPGQAAE